MPALVFSSEIESIENKLPQGLTSVDITSLTPRTNLFGKYVQATIDQRYQLNQKPLPSMKLVLKNSQGSVIDLLAIGKVAEDLNICVQGDVLVCLKFEVEDCPRHYSTAYQMVVDDRRDGSLVWIFKKNDSSKTAVQVKPKQSAAKLNSYCYRPLSELNVNTIVDVYGVVKFYKPPTKTKGSNYCCTVGLIDPSFDFLDDKLSCNIFSPDEAKLPRLQIGYVVRFHRLKIQAFQDRKQGYNGPGFQWLLFRGSFDDREASSSSYTLEQQDEDKVNSLLEWWHKIRNALSSTRGSKKLSEVQPNDYFDLVCQVIRTCDLEASKCKLCRVWDGTKFEGLLRMAKEEDFNDTVQENGTLMEATGDLAVDVYLFDDHMTSAGSMKPGDFIQLTNLHAAVVSGQVEMTLHGGTWFNRGVVVLSRDSPQVGQVESVLDAIIKIKTRSNVSVLKACTVESMHGPAVAQSVKSVNENNVDKNKVAVVKAAVKKQDHIEKQHIFDNSHVELEGARVMTGDLNSMKQLTTVFDGEKCELSETDKHRQDLNPKRHNQKADISFAHKKKVSTSDIHKGHNVEDPLYISSDSGQSLCLSADEHSDFESQNQSNKDVADAVDHAQLQDSRVSSSGTSVDSQCLQASDTKHIDAHEDFLSQARNTGLNQNTMQSSQDSYCTAYSQNIMDTTDDPPNTPKTDSKQRVFLSLKSKDMQEEVGDSHLPLPVTSDDVFSLNTGILCLDTAWFTEPSQAQEVVVVEETKTDTASEPLFQQTESEQYVHKHTESTPDAYSQTSVESIYMYVGDDSHTMSSGTPSEESGNQLRCMLKTASTVIGHTRVSRSVLQDVLEHAVPHKFKVLVRVEDIKPRPVSAASLVHFVCTHCQHFESASSLKVPLDANVPEHMCPNSETQPVKLKPTIILTLLLTDGQHSLEAYLWDKQAVQFFCGIGPLQLVSSDDSFHQVQDWLENLCPLSSTIDDRPLMECCLLSYGTVGNVKYQIFDTVLVT